jgi:hypothetical protein
MTITALGPTLSSKKPAINAPSAATMFATAPKMSTSAAEI